MKTRWLIVFSLFLLLSGCEKITLENMSVQHYIHLLKTGSYNYNDLPAFDSVDIPVLLKYADEDQIITKYPHNPISSLIGDDPRLGVLVLWTIESIRIAPREGLGRFPSLIPGFWNKNSQDGADITIAHPVISQAYKTWWESNSDFAQLKAINPIENTDYRWR